MSREEIRKIFAHLYQEGLRFVFVQGGEPLLRRDLIDILEDLAVLGFSVSLITNGTKFTPDLVAHLARLPLNLSVSLDTLDRDRYRMIRGADQLRLVMNGIDMLAEFPNPKYLTCIVSKANHEDVLEVVRFARDRGFIPVVGAYHWEIERYGRVDPSLQYNRATAVKVFQQVLDSGFIPPGYFRHYVKENIRWLSGSLLNRCDAGRYSITIDASGNVAPCLALKHVGNLRETPLENILANFDREAINHCSNQSTCNMLCSRVIGSTLRHPLSALVTPNTVEPILLENAHAH